jgi:N-acetylglucosaminyl-diphospho-decaprenol L-rhamnosyltransferase
MSIARSDSPAIIGLALNYRDAARTYKCINSLLDDGAAHVFVWDNSADEGTSATELRSLLNDESRITIEISADNLGFAAGVNRGLASIRARFPDAWVLLINNDATLLPGAIDAMTSALKTMPTAVIAYPSINHDGNIFATMYYQPAFALVTFTPLPGSIPYASGCCQLLIPERLQGAWFDEDFFMYGEDVELGWRLGNNRMTHVAGVWVKHEGSASSRMGSPFYESHIVAAHWLLTRKLARSSAEFSLFWLGRAAFLPLRALLRSWRYRSWVPFKSFREGWRLAYRSS